MDETEKEVKEKSTWRIGDTSALFESAGGNPGTVSTGKGDHGGASYGTYQLASGPGTVQEYLKQSRFGSNFKDLKPATDSFNEKWKQVARENSDFGSDQHDFIKRTHVDGVVARLAKIGLGVEERGPAVQDLVWSTAVQYRAKSSRIVERGIKEAFGDGCAAGDLSDAEIVHAVQDSKLRHIHQDFRSSDSDVRAGVETRIQAEKLALIQLAETGSPATREELNRHWIASAPLRRGSAAPRIASLQEKLAGLGMLDELGRPIIADGSFGPATEQAVRAFQRSVGLPPTGQGGALTMLVLDEQHRIRQTVSVAPPDRSQRTDENTPGDALSAYQALAPGAIRSMTEMPGTVQQAGRIEGDPASLPASQARAAEPTALRSRPAMHALPTPEAEQTRVYRLDDPLHPDHDLYLDTKALVHDLDRQHVREPDRYSDNLSAALVVAARSEGLSRIDRIELSHDASRLSAIESSFGQPDRLTDVPVMASLELPLQRSSERWREVMGPSEPREVTSREPTQERTREPQREWAPTRAASLGSAHERDDPRHPDHSNHELYNELQRQVPQASEDRLLQFTAACHRSRITADNLTSVRLDEDRMVLEFQGAGLLTTPARIDLTAPPSQPQESIVQIQQFDRQQTQIMENFQAQQAQLGMGRSL